MNDRVLDIAVQLAAAAIQAREQCTSSATALAAVSVARAEELVGSFTFPPEIPEADISEAELAEIVDPWSPGSLVDRGPRPGTLPDLERDAG